MLSRRSALKGLFGGTAGTLAINSAAAQEAAKPVAPAAQPQGICVLFPQAVEGPYYFDPGFAREDITEGRPGAAMKLVLDVIEYGSCQPISNVRVDVWHSDAGGVYSGYAGQGDDRSVSTKGATYLRGTQTTNAQGRVTFATVYPGWYPGRTPHIHVKVLLDAKEMLTGQVYLPDVLSQRIYHEREPYKSRPDADTTNASDFIFKQGEREGGGTVLTIAETAELITASLIIAVDRTGAAAKRAQGWGQRIRGWFSGRE